MCAQPFVRVCVMFLLCIETDVAAAVCCLTIDVFLCAAVILLAALHTHTHTAPLVSSKHYFTSFLIPASGSAQRLCLAALLYNRRRVCWGVGVRRRQQQVVAEDFKCFRQVY